MNLNKFKKTINTHNPEKGLRDLVGAQKSEHRDGNASTIRVTGTYIHGHRSLRHAGRVIGILTFTSALIASILMLASSLSIISLEVGALFIFGLAFVHIGVLFADGFQQSDAPWARKGVITFWSATLLTLLISLIS